MDLLLQLALLGVYVMPVRYYWYDADRVAYVEIIGHMTKNFILSSNDYFHEVLQTSQAEKVFFIYDASRVTSVGSITHFRSMNYPRHPRCGQYGAMVGASRWVRTMAGPIVKLMFRNTIFFTDTLEEAITDLRKTVPALRDLAYRDPATLTLFLENIPID